MNDLKYCAVRDADDEFHLECRFSDGEKFAALTIDKKVPLAEKLAVLFAYILNNYDLKCSEISDTEADVTVHDLVDDFTDLKEEHEMLESNAIEYRKALLKIKNGCTGVYTSTNESKKFKKMILDVINGVISDEDD